MVRLQIITLGNLPTWGETCAQARVKTIKSKNVQRTGAGKYKLFLQLNNDQTK